MVLNTIIPDLLTFQSDRKLLQLEWLILWELMILSLVHIVVMVKFLPKDCRQSTN